MGFPSEFTDLFFFPSGDASPHTHTPHTPKEPHEKATDQNKIYFYVILLTYVTL